MQTAVYQLLRIRSHQSFVDLRSSHATMSNLDAYKQLGQVLTEQHLAQLSTQLAVFQAALINFAQDHGPEIAAKSEFRAKFTQLCQLVGVDPLELVLHATKSDPNFHIGLSVRIVEVCQETRALNGGLIAMRELVSRLQHNNNLVSHISDSDIQQALSVLDTLGSGYEVIQINDKQWLKCLTAMVGNGFSSDHRRVYEVCSFMGGWVTVRLLRDNYGWDGPRCVSVLEEMVMNGFMWVDAQGEGGEKQYWEPSWISD